MPKQLFHDPQLVRVDELKLYENNAKHFNQLTYERLLVSLKEFGNLGVLIVDSDGTAIDGNTRIKAFQELGFTHCWVFKAINQLPEKIKQRLNAVYDFIGNQSDFDRLDIEIKAELFEDYHIEVELINEDEPEEPEPTFTIKLEYKEDEFQQVKQGLKKIAKTPEEAVYKLLFD